MKKCKLCLLAIADKKNSHIIPKFLGKRLFASLPSRHAIKLSRDTGKTEKEQDIPKEDFILCGSCEKRFELLETYFSRRLNELFRFDDYPNKFQHNTIHEQEYLKCNFRADLFIVFIYSMIWRSSISNLQIFKDFKLPPDIEENIRSLVDSNAGFTQSEMLNSSFKSNDVFNPVICIIKPKEYNDDTRGMLLAYQTSPDAYLLFIAEFMIFFYPNSLKAETAHRNFTLSENAPVLIPLANTVQWNQLKQILFDKLSKNGT